MAYDLPAIIRSIPDFATKTPAECREYLGGNTTEPITTDYTVAMLEDALGTQATELVTATLRASAKLSARFEAAWIAMSVGGIQLYTDERQDAIRQLAVAGNWGDALRDTVLALGQRPTTRWEILSDDDLPDLSEFETAHADALLVEQKTAAGEALRELLTTINDRINDGTLTAEQIASITIPE